MEVHQKPNMAPGADHIQNTFNPMAGESDFRDKPRGMAGI